MSILWFPALLAILLPVAIQVVLHQHTPPKLPVAVAAGASRVRASTDGGAGIFFLVFPLMMSGVITGIVVQRRPTWGIGRRAVVVAGLGAMAALAAFLAAVGLDILPGKPLLLACAFLLTQLASAPSFAAADGT